MRGHQGPSDMELYPYEQIRKRLQPRRTVVPRPEEAYRQIIPLPQPAILSQNILVEWFDCLYRLLNPIYKMLSLEVWINLYPDSLPNIPTLHNVVHQSLTNLPDGGTQAQFVMLLGLTQGLQPDEPNPQSELRRRWRMLERWWNRTLAEIPLTQQGMPIREDLADRYRPFIIDFLNLQTDPWEIDLDHDQREASALLIDLTNDVNEIFRLAEMYPLITRRRITVRLNELAPLDWEDIGEYVKEEFIKDAGPKINIWGRFPATADLVEAMNPLSREIFFNWLFSQIALNDPRIYPDVYQEMRLIVLAEIVKNQPELLTEEVLETILQEQPIKEMKYHEIKHFIELVSAAETPWTIATLEDLLQYQVELRHIEDRSNYPISFDPERLDKIITALGNFQSPAAKQILLNFFDLAERENEFTWIAVIVNHLKNKEGINRIIKYLERLIMLPPEQQFSERTLIWYPVSAAFDALAQLNTSQGLPIAERLLALAQRPVIGESQYFEKAIDSALQYMYSILGLPGLLDRLRDLELHVDPSFEISRYTTTRLNLQQIHEALVAANDFVARGDSNDEKRLERVDSLIHSLQNSKYPVIPPSTINLLINIWKQRIDVNGNLINALAYMDYMDLGFTSLSDMEQFAAQSNDPEFPEFIGHLNSISRHMVLDIINIASKNPTRESEKWFSYVISLTSDCYLWRMINGIV